MKRIEYKKGEVVYNNIEFIKETGYYISKTTKRRKALFLCHCGNKFESVISKIANKEVKSCGCTKHYSDIFNKRYGKLVVIKRLKLDKNNNMKWICKCDCGNEVTTTTNSLNSGHIKSCGCLRKKITSSLNKTHNLSNIRLYSIWIGMKDRCYNTNNKMYHRYGDRNINICNEWKNDFMLFYNWSIENGYKKTLTIDRINNDDDYKPSNCKWATRKEQSSNTINTKKSNILKIKIYNYMKNNKSSTIKEIAKEFDISYSYSWKIREDLRNNVPGAITVSSGEDFDNWVDSLK